VGTGVMGIKTTAETLSTARPTSEYSGPGQVLTGSTSGLNLPLAADVVRVARLGRLQVEWIYGLGRRDKDLPEVSLGVVITGQGPDAVVSDIIAASLTGASALAVTGKGIRLGDPFSSVLGRYGFPTDGLVAFQARPAPTATSVAYAMPGGRPGTPGAPPAAAMAPSGSAGVGVVGESIVVRLDDHDALFTDSCVADYGEIDFTLVNMKVVRIHIADF
jgi:hypothetical protein